MYQPIACYIGLRYMRRKKIVDRFRKFVGWFSIIGIMFGVMSLIVILSVMNGFENELEKKILSLIPQALITNSEECLNSKYINIPILHSINDITNIAPLVTGDVILQSKLNIACGVMLGVNPADPEPLFNYLINIHKDVLLPGKYNIILGSRLALSLGVKCGDVVRLITSTANQFTPLGLIPNQRLFNVVGTFSSYGKVDDYQFLINQQDASRLMRYPIHYITGWRLWFRKPQNISKFSSIILPHGLIWHDWREHEGDLFQAMHMEKSMMILLLSLIIIAGVFNIIISLELLVMEKQGEIAILQTQGFTRLQVMLTFLIQGMGTSIVGTLLGTGLGILFANQLNQFIHILKALFNSATLPVLIKPSQIVIIALLTISVTLISIIYPSWRATIINPAKVLRYE